MLDIAVEIGTLLRAKGLTLGTVESATGGLIAHSITNISGCSTYYKGSIISYSNDIKINVVGVKAATLEKYGAVSSQVAKQMAAGGRKLLGVDICIADTGIAGPTGGTLEKPVGLFHLGLAYKGGTLSREHEFIGDRESNKNSAAAAALAWVMEYLVACC